MLPRLLILFAVLFGVSVPTQAAAIALIRDGETEALLKDYTYPLLAAAGLNPKQVGLFIVDDPNINAFVTGGQNIFFHTGLILQAETPNTVIGVTAHETGHISAGHIVRGSLARKQSGRAALVATILGFGTMLAGAPQAGIALITGGQQVALRTYLVYNRGQEAGADVVALQLLQATRQSPAGIISVMENFAGQEVLSETSQDPYVRAHPMPRHRVSAYIEGAQKSPYFNAKDDPALQFRHDMVRAKLHGFIDSPTSTFRRYARDKSSPMAQYALAIAYHRSAKLDDAIRLIDSLIEQYPRNPWFHELKGQIYYENGKAQKGIAPYKKAVALRGREPLLLIGLATCQLSLAAQENMDEATQAQLNQEAETILRRALRLDPYNNAAYFQLSKTYGQLGKTAYAQWALAEYYALLGNPAAKRHAKIALQGLEKSSTEYLRASDIIEGE
ncbi:MAG: M48 family metallopeptidase [Alphaproteobacteria bacterium]|nr:M48 family metallopeptidase [Alphaproteobacteria bacterium]MBE8220662.1 M48 family metallopeptidase [Alphaproteobacteria bacterium]